MDIRNIKNLAARRLSSAREPQKLVLVYSAVVVLSSLLVTGINHVLGLQIEQTVGLSSLGLRSILSTLETVLPIVLGLALLCWDFGYLLTILRISREQEVNTGMLQFGFQRFWPLLRMTLLQSLLYFGIGILSFNLSMVIFVMTPLSESFMAQAMPIAMEMSALDPTAVPDLTSLDAAALDALYSSMTPFLLLFLISYLALSLPMSYNFRMANYCLLDHPQAGAMAALRESRAMMRGNRLALLKLDISLWWYYLLVFLASLVGYGDFILPLIGVTLPFSAEVGYFLFYAVFLAMEFGIYYYFRNKLEVTYALAYESIRPKEEEKNNGVVLGNIFDM